MRGVVVVFALGLAGCQLVFDVSGPEAGEPCPATTDDPDEDGDGCSNGRDVCVGVADPMQLDDDGDGVGNACDPHQDRAGDTLVAAAFFDEPRFDGGWAADTTMWTFGPGVAVNTFGPETIVGLGTVGGDVSYPVIEVGYDVLEATDGGSSLRIDLATVNCHVDFNGGDYGLFFPDNQPVETTATSQRLVVAVEEDGSTCTLGTADSVLAMLTSARTFTPRPLPAQVSLTNFQVSLRYLAAYEFTPP